jgi:predicted nucleic acid-binding protein
MEQAESKDICIDASAWIRLLAREEGYRELEGKFWRWLDEYDFFVAPSLLIFEIHSSFRKKFKRGEIDASRMLEATKRLSQLPILLYQSQDFFEQVWKWAERLNETVIYDVSYLALAAWKKIPFVTGDRKFYESAKKHYEGIQLI